MGLFINGITDLGMLIVSGLILVPYPPTRIRAFICGINTYGKTKSKLLTFLNKDS